LSTVELAIVCYSATGTLDAMAHHAADGAEKAGAEVRLRRVARPATTGEREADIAALHHLATRVVTVAGRLSG
jgi:NAD(P)H dehydrogenase (quinone)